MKEIQIINQAEEGSKYDEYLGYYKEIKSGHDDIVIVRNFKYKEIQNSEVSSLNNEVKVLKIEEVEKNFAKTIALF